MSRELDKLIAEKVLGVGWCQLMKEGEAISETGPKKCKCGTVGYPYEHHAPYSTDIAAAWEVFEKISKGPTTTATVFFECIRWVPNLNVWEVGAPTESGWEVAGAGETAPLAICRAALSTVQAREGDEK